MFALISSFVFVGAAVVGVSVIFTTYRQSGPRIADALSGRPVTPSLRAAA